MDIWPNFYIVGAGKCGTTFLHQHLSSHPQVFIPPMKEPQYFASAPPRRDLIPADVPYCATEQEYLELYKRARGFAAIGDASTSYLYDEFAATRIHQVVPRAKIIIMLRDPITRAHSEYLMNVGRGFEAGRTFLQALEEDIARNHRDWWIPAGYVGRGLYHDQVKRYLALFGRDQVLILFFTELKNPLALLRKCTNHIGVEPINKSEDSLSLPENHYRALRYPGVHNFLKAIHLEWRKIVPSSVRRRVENNPNLYHLQKPGIDDKSRLLLQEIFEPEIARLESLLGRNLPELRKSWASIPTYD